MAQYDAQSVAVDEPVQVEDTEGNTFTNAFARGTDNLQASLYAASNIIGELTGFDSLASWGEEGMLRNLDEAALNPAEIHSWDDVESLSDFGTYWLETLGEQAPQLLGDLAAGVAGGGIGGIVARRSAMTIAGKAAFGKALKRKTGEGALSKFKDKIKKAGGAGIGVGLSNVAQNAGETQTTFKGAGIDAPGTALAAGIIKGALDTIAPMQLLSIARKAGVPASTVPALIGGILGKVGITTATESATEAAQTVVDHIAQRVHDPDFEMFSDDAMLEIREAAIKGGLVGGTLGGTISTISDVGGFEHDPDGLGRILDEAQRERTPMLYTAEDVTKTIYDGWDSTKAFHLEQIGERQRVIDGVEVDFEAAAVTLANVEEDVQEDPTLIEAPTPAQILLDVPDLMETLETLPINGDDNTDSADMVEGVRMALGDETADAAQDWLSRRQQAAQNHQPRAIEPTPFEALGEVAEEAPVAARIVSPALEVAGPGLTSATSAEGGASVSTRSADKQVPVTFKGRANRGRGEVVLGGRKSDKEKLKLDPEGAAKSQTGVTSNEGPKPARQIDLVKQALKERFPPEVARRLVAIAADEDASADERAYLSKMMGRSRPKTDISVLPRQDGLVPEAQAGGSTSTAADRVAQLRKEDNDRLKGSGYLDSEGNVDLEIAQQTGMPTDASYERAGDEKTGRDDGLTEGVDVVGHIRAPINRTKYAGGTTTKKEGTDKNGKDVWVLGDLEYRKHDDAANAAANMSGADIGRFQVKQKANNAAIFQIHEIVGWDNIEDAQIAKEELQGTDGGPVDPSVSELRVVTKNNRHFLEEVMLADEIATSPLKKISTEVAPGRKGSNSAVTNEEATNLFIKGQSGDADSIVIGGKVNMRRKVQAELDQRYEKTKSQENYERKRDMDDSFIDFIAPDGTRVSFIGTDLAELGQSVMTNEKTTGEFKATGQFRYNSYTTGAALLYERGYIDKRFADERVAQEKDSIRQLEKKLETAVATDNAPAIAVLNRELDNRKKQLAGFEKAAAIFKDSPNPNSVVAGNRNHSTGKGYVLRLNTIAEADAEQRATGQDFIQDALLDGTNEGTSYDATGDQISKEAAGKRRVQARRRQRAARQKLAAELGGDPKDLSQRVETVLAAQQALGKVNRQQILMEDNQLVKFFEIKDGKNVHESEQKKYGKLAAERDAAQAKMDEVLTPPPPSLDQEQTAEYWKAHRKAVKTHARSILREQATVQRMVDAQRRFAGERATEDNVGTFTQQELLQGEGIDTVDSNDADTGFLRENDRDYGPDGTTRITERNRGISETTVEGPQPAPSVAADSRSGAAGVRGAEGHSAKLSDSGNGYDALKKGDPRAEFRTVGPRRREAILPKEQGLFDSSGVPLQRTVGYGNIGKGTVNFVDGMLEAIGLKHIKMVVAHLSSVNDVFKAGHITLEQKVEIEKLFESEPDRKAVFVPRGDSGIIITRNFSDKDLMLSVVGHEVGHGVFSGIEEKIFNPQTARDKTLSEKLRNEFNKDVADPDLPAYTKAIRSEFKEWFSDKMSAYARGLAKGRGEKARGLAEKLFQSSAEQLRTVFNRTKGQTNPRFHRNMKFENVIKAYVKDNVFENISSIGYGKIESIILGPPITGQTATLTHAHLGQGVQFLRNLGNESVIGKTPFKRLFDVHNRMQMHGMQSIADMIYKETNTRAQHAAYYNMLNNARAEFAGKLKVIFPKKETAENMNQVMEQLAQELPTAQLTPKAKAVRKLLGEFHKYMNDAGFPVEFDPLFFPRDYQLSTIEARPQQFLDILTSESTPGAQDALSLPQARAVLEGFLTPIDPNDPDGLLAKKLQAQYERKIPSSKMKGLVEAGFATTDPQSAFKRYVDKHTQYAEHYRAFGGFEYLQGYHSRRTIEEYAADADKAAAYTKNRRLLEGKMRLHELWKKPTNPNFTQEQTDEYYHTSLMEAQRRGYVKDDGDNGFQWIHPDSKLRDKMQVLTEAHFAKHGDAAKTKKWVEEANTLIEHALGRNSRPNRNGFIFNLIGEVRAYESLRTLMFSGVASVPEIAVAFQRSKGEVGMADFARIVWDSVRNYDDAKELAEVMGLIQNDMASIIAMDMLSVHDGEGGVGRLFRKGIGPLMKYNGNEMIVNLSRVVAMKAGMHFLRSSALKATGPEGKAKTRALRYLEELNIDAATVIRWMDDVQYKGLKESSTQSGNSHHANDAARVRAALNTFANETVMRPNAAERPTWADHPIGTFVYHLKTFAYSFGKRVVGGAIREINARHKEGDSRIDALTESMVYALPSLMVFTLFGAMSDELRNRIATLAGEGEWRGTWGANREDPLAMVGKWMSRAGLITSAPFFDPVYDTLTGNPSVNSFAFGAGPLASHAFDLFKPNDRSDSVKKKVLKSLPIVNQLPYLKGVNAMPPVKNKGVAGAIYDWAKSFFVHVGPRDLKSRFSGVITEIEDGDTAFVRMANGKVHHVRLFGIDTNEKTQQGGDEQTAALSDMVLGKRVVISDYGTGLFGRMLGVIHLDGVDINAKMLEEGKAWYSHTYAEDLPDDLKKLYVKSLNNAFVGKKSQWDGRQQLDPQTYKKMMRAFEKAKKRAAAVAADAEPKWWEFSDEES